MEKTNIYDVLNTIGPSLIVAIISFISIKTSYNRQRNDNQKDLKLKRIEEFYKKLILINRFVQGEIKLLQNQKYAQISNEEIRNIVRDIELLKIEAKLYLRLNNIEGLRITTEQLLNLIQKCDSVEKYNDFSTREKEKIRPGVFKIVVPSELDILIEEYEDEFDRVEDFILDIAQKEIGYKKRRIKSLKKRARHTNLK